MTPVVAIAIVAIGVLAWLIAAPWWRARRRAAHIYRSDPDYPDEMAPPADPTLGVKAGDVVTAS